MGNFTDKFNTLSRQCISAAVILDRKGQTVGKILIRFTNSQIGYNHQLTVLFLASGLDYRNTVEGGTYEQPGTLWRLFNQAGITVLDHDKRKIGGYDTKNAYSKYDSLSRFSELEYIRYNRKLYRLAWAI